jgi:hypothetical protein
MLSYFPVAYSDELLYSMIARYAKHTGQTENHKSVIRDTFGSDTAVAIPDLPSHLSALQKQLSRIWPISVVDLIRKYTLGPFYLPFLPKDKARLVVDSMGSSNGGNIHTRTGIAAGVLHQPAAFRFCPQCYEEQQNQLGESYWQRIHHLPMLNTCFRHNCVLVDSSLPFHPKAKHLFRSAQDECTTQPFEIRQPSEIENRLYSLIQEIFQIGRISGFSIHQWTNFYQKIADDLGFKKGTRVDHSGVRKIVEKHWKLSEIGASLLNQGSDDWLVQLFRKHRKSFHPLRHLVIWSSLLPDMDAKQIFRIVAQTEKGTSKNVLAIKSVCGVNTSAVSEYRRLWREILHDNPGQGVKSIRSTKPGCAIYAWLYRHDRIWLMSHRPPRVNIGNHHSSKTTNWDNEILCSLKRVYEKVHPELNRPRLSRTYLINQIPRSNSIAKHLNDLPQTRKWLNLYAESIEKYQLHRVVNAVKTLRARELQVKRWRILRAAGIRFHSVPSSVEHAIRTFEFKELNKWS